MLETVKKCTCQGSNIQELKKFKGILFLQTCSSSLSSLIRKSSSNRFASALLHSEASVGIWSRWIWCLDRKIWVKVNWLVSILQLGLFINVRCIINWTAFFFFTQCEPEIHFFLPSHLPSFHIFLSHFFSSETSCLKKLF